MIALAARAPRPDFLQLMRAAGLKATPARVTLVSFLARQKKPLSVQAIGRRLRVGAFDQATVYRALKALTAAGLIRRIDLRHGHAHYELATADHHHVVCLTCDRIADVTNCDLTRMTRVALRQSGFAEIREHSLEFFGICQKCRA